MMKKTGLLMLVLLLGGMAAQAQTTAFARGADVSWCTEMEADGKRFYNADGEETEIMTLMKQVGMNAIRLRVWVNPETAYGPWSDKADVLAKARRAKAAGLDLMIDFHYSDFFADPGTQTKPSAWTAYSFDQLKQAVADHTRDVLQALKDEGVEPKWVQVGNETNTGMVWDSGKIDWNKSGAARYANYVALSNAGYGAVKEVLPGAYVIVHIGGAKDAGDYDCWFFTDLKNAGGKFDMIGLSHYPDWTSWSSDNTKAANSVKALAEKFHVPVMIVETGYSASDEARAGQVMADVFGKLKDLDGCAGIFYWEPEVYGSWRPAYYSQLGWNSYGMGAFTAQGRPSKALAPFYDETAAVDGPTTPTSVRQSNGQTAFDLQGRRVSHATPHAVTIEKTEMGTRKVAH